MLKLFQSMTEVPAGRRAIALGTFDGVHLGHRAVIAAARRSGERLAAVTCAATFHPRPATLLNPDVYPATLAGVTQRVRLLGEAGAEEVVLLRFNRALADLTAEEFVEQVVVEQLGAIAVTVGSDFRFGRDRSGDVALLGELCARHGVEVEAIAIVDAQGAKISSSRIRDLIDTGDVADAATLLGRLPSVEGAVMHGDHRGREIGFPTANLSLVPGQQVPAEGVYAGWGVLPPGEQRFAAAISVGQNPHFGDVHELRVEAHLLGYEGPDVYGLPMRIEFADRLRAQETYDTLDALKAQIGRDVTAVAARLSA